MFTLVRLLEAVEEFDWSEKSRGRHAPRRMAKVKTSHEAVAVVRSGKETELTVGYRTKWTQQQLGQLADALKTNSVLTTLVLWGAIACHLWVD